MGSTAVLNILKEKIYQYPAGYQIMFLSFPANAYSLQRMRSWQRFVDSKFQNLRIIAFRNEITFFLLPKLILQTRSHRTT